MGRNLGAKQEWREAPTEHFPFLCLLHPRERVV